MRSWNCHRLATRVSVCTFRPITDQHRQYTVCLLYCTAHMQLYSGKIIMRHHSVYFVRCRRHYCGEAACLIVQCSSIVGCTDVALPCLPCVRQHLVSDAASRSEERLVLLLLDRPPIRIVLKSRWTEGKTFWLISRSEKLSQDKTVGNSAEKAYSKLFKKALFVVSTSGFS